MAKPNPALLEGRAQQDTSTSSDQTFGDPSNPGLIGDSAIGKFVESTIAGFGEVVGIDPSRDVQRFRGENPVAGLASQAVGFATPYIGWEKAAASIPSMAKVIGRAEALGGESALARGALREAAKLAPFEAGRTAVAVGSGNAELGEMLRDNALSLGIGGAAGAAVEGFRSLPKVLDDLQGFVDTGAPKQEQLRKLREIDMTELDEAQTAAVNRGKVELGYAVRAEGGQGRLAADEFGKRTRKEDFVFDLGGSGPTHGVNGLFREGRKLIRDEAEGFAKDEDWLDVLRTAGISREGFESNVATPRWVDFADKNTKAVRNRMERVGRGMQKVSDDTYLAREADSGLYTVARRTKAPEGKGPNGLLLFKTDTPDRFNLGKAKWTDNVANSTAWEQNLREQAGHSTFLDTHLGVMGRISGSRGSTQAKNALVDSLQKGFGKYISPRTFQLRDSALGRGALMATEAVFDLASSRAKRLTYGARAIDEERNKLGQFVLGNLKLEGASVKSAANEVTDWDTVSQVLTRETPFEDVQQMYTRGEISKAGMDLLGLMKRISDSADEQEILPLQKLLQLEKYSPRKGHYGVPRLRPGDHRVRIQDENGQTVYLLGARTSRAAQKQADDLVAAASQEGRTWVRSEPFVRDETLEAVLKDEQMMAKIADSESAAMADRLFRQNLRRTSSSASFRPRTNVEGFETAWDADTLVEAYGKHLDTKMRYAASMASRHSLDQYADKIRVLGGKHAFDVVERRLKDFEGTPGDISRATNKAVDKVLAPALGKNSATKIASTVNQVYMQMTLGAGNIAYPAINTLTFMQTVMPHVAFVKNAPDDMMARYYDSVVMRARDGLQAGATVSPMKLSFQAAKQLKSGEKGWLKAVNRAANDGTVDPRLIEDYIGETSEKYLRFRENMKDGPGGWARSLYGLTKVTMESGERISRAHGFANGYLLGKDFLKLEGEDLYQFAKRFTDNTMYRYATPDRPTLFAGPVGSTFGLFKNWMMHYTMWMVEHAGMAAKNPTSMNAWKPLLWQVGGTTAIGGVGSWPFASLMNNFSEFTSGKDLMQQVYSNATLDDGDTTLADGLYYGLPATLGLSLSAQAELPFHAPLSDAEFLATPVQMRRIQALFTAIGDSVDRFDATGRFNPMDSQKLSLEWAKAVTPKTMYHSLQVALGDGGIRSGSTGSPLVEQVGLPTKIGHALGLQSVEMAKRYEISQQLWNDQSARRARVQALGQEWKEAQAAGDFRAVQDVFVRASSIGIDPSRVVRSAQARLRREEQSSMEYNFSQEEISRYMRKMQGGQ